MESTAYYRNNIKHNKIPVNNWNVKLGRHIFSHTSKKETRNNNNNIIHNTQL